MRYYRRLLPFLFVGILLCTFAVTRLYRQSADRFHKAEDFSASGRITEAIEYYEWAIQGYYPWNPYVPRALNALEGVADRSLKEARYKQARQALQAIVSGLAVIEHFRQPFPDRYARALEKLTRLENRMREQSTLSPESGQPKAPQPAGPEIAPATN